MSCSALRFAPDPKILFAPISDAEGILLNLVTQRYYSLNETGMAIWQKIRDGTNLNDLTAALKADYDIIEETAGELISEFLEALLQENLIQQKESNSPTE